MSDLPVFNELRESRLSRIDWITLWLAEFNLGKNVTVTRMYEEQDMLAELDRLNKEVAVHEQDVSPESTQALTPQQQNAALWKEMGEVYMIVGAVVGVFLAIVAITLMFFFIMQMALNNFSTYPAP